MVLFKRVVRVLYPTPGIKKTRVAKIDGKVFKEMKHTYHIIALGGSLIVPHLSDNGGVEVAYLKKFRTFLLSEIKNGKRFIVVAGGGRIARVYQKAISQMSGMTRSDLDWIGIHALTVNSHLIRLLFKGYSHPEVLTTNS